MEVRGRVGKRRGLFDFRDHDYIAQRLEKITYCDLNYLRVGRIIQCQDY